jgi:hypothetical protein
VPVEQAKDRAEVRAGPRHERPDEEIVATPTVEAVPHPVAIGQVDARECSEHGGRVGLEDVLPIARVLGVRARLRQLLAGLSPGAGDALAEVANAQPEDAPPPSRSACPVEHGATPLMAPLRGVQRAARRPAVGQAHDLRWQRDLIELTYCSPADALLAVTSRAWCRRITRASSTLIWRPKRHASPPFAHAANSVGVGRRPNPGHTGARQADHHPG